MSKASSRAPTRFPASASVEAVSPGGYRAGLGYTHRRQTITNAPIEPAAMSPSCCVAPGRQHRPVPRIPTGFWHPGLHIVPRGGNLTRVWPRLGDVRPCGEWPVGRYGFGHPGAGRDTGQRRGPRADRGNWALDPGADGHPASPFAAGPKPDRTSATKSVYDGCCSRGPRLKPIAGKYLLPGGAAPDRPPGR